MQVVWDPRQAVSALPIPFIRFVGAEYELVTRKLTWGEDRVFYYDANGKLKSLLTNVTDVVSKDAFDCVSAGRSAFRVDDLLELQRLFDRRREAGRESIVCKGNIAAYGRRTLPHETCGRWHSNVLSVAAYLNASDSRTHPERLPLLTFLLTSDAYEA